MNEAELRASGVWTEWARNQLSQEYPAGADCLIVFEDRRVRLLDASGVERGAWSLNQNFVEGIVGSLSVIGKPPPQRSVADIITDFVWDIFVFIFVTVPDFVLVNPVKKIFRRLS